MRSASIFFNCPARPDSPRIDSASLFSTWASNWSISSTGNGYGAFCFLGFLVVITSVMEFPFRYYFMTSLHTENLTGSGLRIERFNELLQLAPQCHTVDLVQETVASYQLFLGGLLKAGKSLFYHR